MPNIGTIVERLIEQMSQDEGAEFQAPDQKELRTLRTEVRIIAEVIHNLKLAKKSITLRRSCGITVAVIDRVDEVPGLYRSGDHVLVAHQHRTSCKKDDQVILQRAGVKTERRLFLHPKRSTLNDDSRTKYAEDRLTYGDLLRNDPLSLMRSCALV
jgi:hypothetical protein